MSAGYAERLSEYPNKVGGRILYIIAMPMMSPAPLTSYILIKHT